MATTIDKKIIEMELRNREFEARSQQTMSTLDKLKQKLDFKGIGSGFSGLNKSVRGFDVSPMTRGINAVVTNFSALGVAGATVISNLTSQIMGMASRMGDAVFVAPLRDGLNEYETKLNSIQTILANTQSKGTTMKDVIVALDELNTYSDKTIYNFAEMTRNIGTFTAAGISLETSTEAIKGIANLAAISGSNSQQASTAMYQLSQALASGSVKLMDWNSVVNAGMGGQVFQDSLKETARLHGIQVDAMIKKEGSFRESLKEGWITSEVLTDTLAKFTGDLSESQLKQKGYTAEQIAEIMKLGQTASDAATKVKTFSQLMDTLKEALGSGWAKTWEYIIGDFEQAKKLWTSVSDVIGGMINNSADARNAVVSSWVAIGGRDILLNSLAKAGNNLKAVFDAIAKAWRSVFPPVTANKLLELTQGFSKLVDILTPSQQQLDALSNVFKNLFTIIKMGLNFIKTLGTSLYNVFKNGKYGTEMLKVLNGIGQWLIDLAKNVDVIAVLEHSFTTLGQVIENVWESITSFDISKSFNNFVDFFKNIPDQISKMLSGLKDIERTTIVGGLAAGGLGLLLKPLIDMFKGAGAIKDLASNAVSTIGEIFDAVGDAFKDFSRTMKVNQLLSMAKALALLAASIFILAMIPADKLKNGVAAIAVMMGSLVVSMKLLGSLGQVDKDKQKGHSFFSMAAGFLALAVAIGIISIAAAILSTLNLPKALGSLIVIMTALTAVAVVIDKSVDDILKTSIGMVMLATAFGVLAISALALSIIPTDKIGGAVLSLVLLMSMMGLLVRSIDGASIIKTAIGMIILSTSIAILAGAVLVLSFIPIDKLATGIVALGVVLIGLAIAVEFMSKSLVGIGSIILLSIALNLLILPITVLASLSLSSLITGIVGVAAVLAILMVATSFLSSAIVGAGSLILLAGALAILAGSVWLMAQIPTDALWQAILAVGALFAILLIAAAIATALAPGLLILAVAILALGAAVLIAGIGMGLFATAMGTFAALGTAGFAVLSAGLLLLANIIPGVVKKFLEGFTLILNFVIDNAPLIADALSNMLGVFVASIPISLTKAVGFFIQGFKDLCQTVETEAEPLAEAVVGALDAMVNAIDKHWNKISDDIGKLITGLLGGVSKAIRDYGPQILYDTEYIMGFAAEGLVRGLGSFGPNAVASMRGLGSDFIGALTGEKENTYTEGYKTAQAYTKGIADGSNGTSSAMTTLVQSMISEMNNKSTGITMSPILDMTQPNLQLTNFNAALTQTHKDAAKMEGTINTHKVVDVIVSGGSPIQVDGSAVNNQTATSMSTRMSDQVINQLRKDLRWGLK